MAFRLPRLLRGDIRDFNRASAEAALEFAENQVFAPARNEFDHIMNQRFLAPMGIRFWRFASNGVQVRDPLSVSTMITEQVKQGILTPRDGRRLSGELCFSQIFPEIDEPWADRPIALTTAGITAADPADSLVDSAAADAAPAKRSLVKSVRKLLRLRDAYAQAEVEEARANHAAASTVSTEKITVTPQQAMERFGIELGK